MLQHGTRETMRLKELDIALKLQFAEGCMCTTGKILQTLTFEVHDNHVNIIRDSLKWFIISSFEFGMGHELVVLEAMFEQSMALILYHHQVACGIVQKNYIRSICTEVLRTEVVNWE